MLEAPPFQLLFENLPGRVVAVLPQGPAYPVVAVTDHYLETVHKTRAELVGKGLFDVFPGGPDEAHRQTIERIRQSFEEIIVTRKSVRISTAQRYDLDPTQERHWALLSKPVFDPKTGEVLVILHEVEDVTAQVVAERHRHESEEHLRYTVELNTQIPWTADPQGNILDFSPKWLELTGLDRTEALGTRWMQTPHPEDRDRMVAAWRHATSTGEPYDVQHRIRARTGTYVWMHTRAYPRRDPDGNIVRWYGTTEDIDANVAAERRNAFLVELDDAMRPLTEPVEITEVAARMLSEHLDVTRCAYSDVEPDEKNFQLIDEWNRGSISIIGRYQFNDFGAGCLALMEEGLPWVVEDSESDPRTQEVLDIYRKLQIRAVIGVPLRKQSRIVAGLAVHHAFPRRWQKGEVELVQQVASRCWESLERARVTQALREREQRFRFLAEAIPQMVWTADPEGRLDYVNAQVTRYFGQDTQDLMGEGWLRWVHPDDQDLVVQRWTRSVATGEDYEAEFRLRRASDGQWRWHLVRAQALIGQHGKVTQWFGTCTDFEDQKQSEKHLRQQWEMFDTSLSHTPDFAYLFDLQGRFTYLNRSLLNLWNITLDQALGKTFSELPYPQDLALRLSGHIATVIKTRQPVHDEGSYTTPGGQTGYYEYTFTPVFAEDGSVRAVAGSTRDFTQRRQTEQALAASEERLQAVFRQAPVAILVLRGPDYIVELANPHYVALLGGRPLHGRPFAEAVPELDPSTWHNIRRVVETGEPYHASEAKIPYDFDQDGEIEDHWFNVDYNPLRDNTGGAVTGFIAVLTEVTAQVKARRELERMNRELESFAYVASHDLQEPLRMVNIYSELLVKKYGDVDDPRARKFREFIQEGVVRMEALIRDLLSYSRSAQDQGVPSTIANLHAVLLDAQASLQGRIEETSARIILDDAAGDLPIVRGDASQLSQLLQNILSNALKYVQSGVTPEIRINWRRSPELPTHWHFSFADNGIGFEQEYAVRIFGLFKRLHKDEYPGTGLGLAICQRIVERHGGCIWAEGVPGQGAVFHFTIPAMEAASLPPPVESADVL